MINIISVNVNGLKHRTNQLCQLIYDHKSEIVCIQEVHDFSNEQVHDLEKKLKATIYLNSHKGWTGTGIILRGKLQNLTTKHLDVNQIPLQNRVTHIQIKAKRIIDLISIYAPAHEDRKAFYDSLNDYLNNFINHNIILCGDFNYAELEVDRIPKLNKYDKRFQKIFKPKNFKLIDTFRNKYPTKQDFTHKTARIDRIYVSETILNTVHNVKHLNTLADHRPVYTQINFDDIKLWGKFYWKLNNYFLNDTYYQQEINSLFDQYETRKNSTNCIQNWELLKQEIKSTSKSYANFKSKERKLQQDIINQMKDKNLDPDIRENLTKTEEDLKSFINSGNRVRAKNDIINRIYDEGREINRKQEIKNGNQKFIFQVKRDDEIIYEKSEIIQEIQNFYQVLYQSQKIPNQNIDDYLNDFHPSTLNSQQNDLLKQPIQSEEIREVIFNLNKDKSPGQDGLTSEFYQTFWPRLVPILKEVYLNIFNEGSLSQSMRNGLITLI